MEEILGVNGSCLSQGSRVTRVKTCNYKLIKKREAPSTARHSDPNGERKPPIFQSRQFEVALKDDVNFLLRLDSHFAEQVNIFYVCFIDLIIY